MANENVIQATFDGFYKTYTDPSWLIDHGMELSISGIDLPEEFECHFSNSRSVAAKRQIGENGVVTIPDEYFLSNAAQIFCWIYLHPTVDSGVTEYEIVIPLRQRPNVDPSEPTQEQQDIVDRAIAALNAAVEQTGQDVEDANNAAESARESADAFEGMIAEEYDENKTYTIGDYSIHNDVLYRCTTAITTAEAWTAAHWVEASISEDMVTKAGIHQVLPQNISGVGYTVSQETGYGNDIFSESYLGESGYYAHVDTGTTPPKLTHAGLSGYRWYAIPVDGESKYVFTEARFACLAKGNTVGSEAIGTTLPCATEVTATGASYLILSYASSVTTVEVRRIETTTVYKNFVMPAWMQNGLDAKKKYVSGTGSFSTNGDKILLGNARTNLRKGSRLVFEGKVTSGADFDIGFSVSESTINNPHNVISITSTSIIYNNTSYTHGLTVSGMVQLLFEYLSDGTAGITLQCNGASFKQEVAFNNLSVAVPYVESKGLIATDCKLTFICTDIDKKIWMFGDSYFAFSNTRWPYYLHEYGYDVNVLLDGFPGEGSVNARQAFNKLLAMGTPKFAVWCMGMNDGGDTDASTPNSDWTSGKNYFLGYCADNNVTPIFATIPTVPTVNNEGKNAWIRASGYRYIDFALAVGATSSGTWYSGMLSSDNVHPTEKGAKALFARFMVDFPEIMVSE